MKRLPLIVLLIALASSPPLYAAENSELDEVMEGFDDTSEQPSLDEALEGFDDETAGDPPLDEVLDNFDDTSAETAASEQSSEPDSPWQLSGSLTLSASYNYAHDKPEARETDHRGLSRLRTKLNLELEGDLGGDWKAYLDGYALHDFAYQIKGRDEFSDQQLDDQEQETELGEAWIQGSLTPSLDLKLGRQLVVWGKSDNLRVTDVINPMDQREMGLVDIEDLRLPLAMARLDYYWEQWSLTALAIPEIRFNKTPSFGSDFYAQPGPPLQEEVPSDGGANTEYAAALNGIFSGWDLALYWARIYDDQPHNETIGAIQVQHHSRLTMAGIAANLALGNWLLKGEAAHFDGLEFTPLPGEKKSRSDLLLGVEYSGFDDTTLSLEVVDRHLHDYDSVLADNGTEEDEWQTALRYSGEFLHARLKLTALAVLFGEPGEGGGFGRFQGDYELADSLNFSTGLVVYDSGDKRPFTVIGDNDRLFLDLKYSF